MKYYLMSNERINVKLTSKSLTTRDILVNYNRNYGDYKEEFESSEGNKLILALVIVMFR